jgi:hypothetical protein
MLDVRCTFGCPTSANVIVGFWTDPAVGTKAEGDFLTGLDATPSRPREPPTGGPEFDGPEPEGVEVGTDASLLPRRFRGERAADRKKLLL